MKQSTKRRAIVDLTGCIEAFVENFDPDDPSWPLLPVDIAAIMAEQAFAIVDALAMSQGELYEDGLLKDEP